MLRIGIVLLLLFAFTTTYSQGYQLTIAFGEMNYQGDLQSSTLTTKLAQSAFSGYLKYDAGNKLVYRAGLTYGNIYGDDAFNPSPQKERNLNFRSKIGEFQVAIEYHFIDGNIHRISPYVFAGLAYFHFDPYTNDTANRQVYLHYFSTEGQGLPEYPDRKPYSLNQFAIPFGVGISFRLNCALSIGAEIGERKLFTDYLDDVSKRYVDYNTLLKAKGPLAVKLAYREPGDYPADINTAYNRGNPKNKDWYYTGMITLTYHFSGCSFGKVVNSGSQYSCPKRVL